MKTLSELINSLNLTSIKELLAYVPGAVNVGRKDVLVSSMLEQLSGTGWRKAWEQLDGYQRLAVSEAAHNTDGIFLASRFIAKYGQLFFPPPPPQSRL